jgi:hypothetical protein
MRPGLCPKEPCSSLHVPMSLLHLHSVSFVDTETHIIKLTLCSSHASCSLRRSASTSSRFLRFSSAASAFCNFSLSCCFFSISSRFLCAGLADDLFRLLNTFPKRRWVRCLSCAPVLVLAWDGFRCGGGDMAFGEPWLMLLLGLNRGRLLEVSEDMDDCRRFNEGAGSWRCSSGSGTTTADWIMILQEYQITLLRSPYWYDLLFTHLRSTNSKSWGPCEQARESRGSTSQRFESTGRNNAQG